MRLTKELKAFLRSPKACQLLPPFLYLYFQHFNIVLVFLFAFSSHVTIAISSKTVTVSSGKLVTRFTRSLNLWECLCFLYFHHSCKVFVIVIFVLIIALLRWQSRPSHSEFWESGNKVYPIRPDKISQGRALPVQDFPKEKSSFENLFGQTAPLLLQSV